jgi:hypothetical protein
MHYINYSATQYMQITTAGTYTASFSATFDATTGSTGYAQVTAAIYDMNGTLLYNGSGYSATPELQGTGTLSMSLCPGIYEVISTYIDTSSTIFSGEHSPYQHELSMHYTINSGSGTFKTSQIEPNCIFTLPIPATDSMLNQQFALVPGQQMEFSGWVRQDCATPCFITNYTSPTVTLQFPGADTTSISLYPKGTIIEGWQRVDTMFSVPTNATTANLVLGSDSSLNVYFDDIRMHPFNADMKSYIYDPQTLRLMAELDENNYATFYDYDEEGQLVRVKKETVQGVKTIKETRTAKQKSITNVQ